jgi:streptogramin lyase
LHRLPFEATILVMLFAAVHTAGSVEAARASFCAPSSTGHDALALGAIREFVVPGGNSCPQAIAAGPDGNLWFTESNRNQIVRITATGLIREFALPPASLSAGIAAGPDRNVWFTEFYADKIGRITPSGTVSEFQVPTANSGPGGIAAGPDGNLWFTEHLGNKIGRITPSGAVSEFSIPTADSAPDGIAAGSDGNLWFTELVGNKVGRITPDGTLDEFSLQTPSSEPAGIAAGPDGNIWFTELNGNKIGRITPGGAISEYGIPTAGGTPWDIAAGSDGNLWFTEYNRGKIGRITPGGAVSEFLIPTPGSKPEGIAAGPDGNIWFAEFQGNNIGRLTAAEPDTRYVLSLDGGFAPSSRQVKRGFASQWTFLGPRPHSVTDLSGMGLFDSGVKPIVSYFAVAFTAAGSYPYGDTLDPALTGTIEVPIRISPRSGDSKTNFTVIWASAPPPAGFGEDIQVKRPGSPAFVDWITGQTGRSAPFTADAGPGTYSFRARLHKSANDTHSGYSVSKSILVA